jgi:hypothetical protein
MFKKLNRLFIRSQADVNDCRTVIILEHGVRFFYMQSDGAWKVRLEEITTYSFHFPLYSLVYVICVIFGIPLFVASYFSKPP